MQEISRSDVVAAAIDILAGTGIQEEARRYNIPLSTLNRHVTKKKEPFRQTE